MASCVHTQIFHQSFCLTTPSSHFRACSLKIGPQPIDSWFAGPREAGGARGATWDWDGGTRKHETNEASRMAPEARNGAPPLGVYCFKSLRGPLNRSTRKFYKRL